jgi:glycosyltransferase involved in cell wall biosynthesis
MFVPPENANGTAAAAELERLDTPPTNGALAHNRLLAAPRAPIAALPEPDDRPVLAVFCYDEPDSATTRFVANIAGPLADGRVALHVFTRKALDLSAAGATVHVLGEDDEGGLLDRVQEFTHRVCNAFLRRFQGTAAPVTLMGCEWSAVPAMSILRGIKDLNTILSLHSLERQRSDMTSELSQAIEAIELSGLREARTVLVHEPATAEVARYWVPECADRTVCVRLPFPEHRFNRQLDPGAVKARYQVGPIDPTIVYVGDLDERYGPDLLVKAMPAVLKNHPQARLIVVGDGSEYWPLRVYARYLLLEHAVRLPGHVEGAALDELITAADVIAVPGREATPWWPILAGWAARRPVVATHNVAPGLLEHEQDAVLFYPNVNSSVWGIERVLFDAGLGQRMGEKGHRKLGERFGWGAVAAQVEELMAGRARH